MNALLEEVVTAHGGLGRWNQLQSVRAHLHQGGVFWGLKGHQGQLDDVFVTADLHRQAVSHRPFGAPDLQSSYTPDRVSIERSDGTVVEELKAPRSTFEGLALDAPWTNLQLVYFVGTSMWTYLTQPFTYALPGFEVAEVKPWSENEEESRRLQVRWPDEPVGHSKVQTLYVGDDFLLRRFDYDIDIAVGAKGAHYLRDYTDVAGIMMPMSHTIVARDDRDVPISEPVLVSIELDDVVFAVR
jgi:hypothetical protein